MQFAWSTPPDFGAMLGDDIPAAEASTAVPGTALKASRDDHKHPRMTSATVGTLDSNGDATVTFTRSFDTEPSISLTYRESANSEPVILKVVSWVMSAGKYVGCIIKGYRLRTLPASIALLSVLISFSISLGSAAGVSYTCIALQSSVI